MATTFIVLSITFILIVQLTPLTLTTLTANRIVHVFRLQNEIGHGIQIWKNPPLDFNDVDADHPFLEVRVSGIHLKPNVSAGTYHALLKQDESESQPDLINLTIHVNDINEKVIFFHSCRIRISDLVADQLLSQPPKSTLGPNSTNSLTYYDLLRKGLFEVLKLEQPQLHPDCIFLFAVRNEYDKRSDNYSIHKFTIVRIAVRKSPKSEDFLAKEYITGLLTLKRDELSKSTGLAIESIGYNECMKERNVLCNDSCTSRIKISKSESMLYQGDTDSMASIRVQSEATCICLADQKAMTANCDPFMCRNRGDCFNSLRGPSCHCREPFDGPNCEKQSIEFTSSSLWMWLPPLQTCAKSILYIEFSTQMSNCLLLYNGPLTQADSLNIPDFVSLELKSGLPRLLIDTGAGPAELVVAVNETLNDNRLHSLLIYWINGNVSMVVDHCISHNPCVNSATMPGLNRYLNVNMPLQLGKVRRMDNFTLNFGANATILPPNFKNGFKGYIGKLKFNDFVYDMSHEPQQQELIDVDKANVIEEPDPVQESNAAKGKIALIVLGVLMLILLLLIWRNLLKQKLAKLKKQQDESQNLRPSEFNDNSLAKENITRIFVTNSEMKKAIELSSKHRSQNSLNKSKDAKGQKEQNVKYDSTSQKATIGSPLFNGGNEQKLASLTRLPQEMASITSVKVADFGSAPLDLTKRWSKISKEPPGPPDQTITYAFEGGNTPEPSLSTITAVGMCSQVDHNELVDDFIQKHVGYESAGSTVDGAEDYV